MTVSEPRLLWVNHASYVLRHNGIRLITDPWLDGLAFNRGRSLLSPTRFPIEDFADITHIWLSHEHPITSHRLASSRSRNKFGHGSLCCSVGPGTDGSLASVVTAAFGS